MAIYGYARVSTLGQELKEQKSLLKKNSAEIFFFGKNICHKSKLKK